MPRGADAIVMIEDTDVQGKTVTVKRVSKDRFYQEEGRESFDWSGSAPCWNASGLPQN